MKLPVEVWGCAVVNVVPVIAEIEEGLAIVAPVALELIECLENNVWNGKKS